MYHSFWHHDILRIRAVDEQQIIAEIRQIPATVITPIAGCRVIGHHPHPLAKIFHGVSHCSNGAAKFVSKHGGGGNHAGVSTLQKDFEIGAAGRRRLNAHEDVCLSERRDWDRFEGDVARAVE